MDIKQLLGKKVQNIKTKRIGVITAVQGNMLFVNTAGETIKYLYPDAFATTLILEDERLQGEMEYEAANAAFDSFRKLYKNSIFTEISYLKETGGKRYKAIEGELIDTINGEYIYSFDTDIELHFPDNTQIKIWQIDTFITAYVISCEEFSIIFRTKEFLGKEVESIEFSSEQWRLLETLNERLDEMSGLDSPIAYKVACRGRIKIRPNESVRTGQDFAFKRGTSEDVTFIWGPPGTGKTKTLSQIALEYIENGYRVLMLSYSNVSVDGALLRVVDMADCAPGQVIRYGYPRVKRLLESKEYTSYQYVLNKHPELAMAYQQLVAEKKKLKKKDPKRLQINKEIAKIKAKLAEEEKILIHNAAFVATTVSKAVVDKEIYEQRFDVVIFDEASMAYVPQIVFAAGLAKKAFVCLGDFRQLPAIVQNNIDDRLSRDIFEYCGITEAVENEYGHEWLVMLNVQYRMHPDIADFVGKQMYGGKLFTGENIYEARQMIADNAPLEEEAMGLIDLSGTYSVCIKTMDGSKINLLSAMLSVAYAEKFISSYETGIITPYSAQSRLIIAMIRDMQERDKRFKNLSSATVHQFQGSEKPVIIYDAVECFRERYVGPLLSEVKNNTANRLFNVALTRAQGKFLMILNQDFFRRKRISRKLVFTKLLDRLTDDDIYQDGDEIIEEFEDLMVNESAVYVGSKEDTWTAFIDDINSAEKEICIEIPGMIDGEDELVEFLDALEMAEKRDVAIYIYISEEVSLPKRLERYVVPKFYVTTPVTVIDREIVWYGQPLANADFISEGDIIPTEYYPCARFKGLYTARIVRAFYGM